MVVVVVIVVEAVEDLKSGTANAEIEVLSDENLEISKKSLFFPSSRIEYSFACWAHCNTRCSAFLISAFQARSP